MYKRLSYRYLDGTVVNRQTFGWRSGQERKWRKLGSVAIISFYGVQSVKMFWGSINLPFICEFPRFKGLTLVHYINSVPMSWHKGEKSCRDQGASLAYQGIESINKRV